MRIRWHGHACWEIENEKTIVTDPHDGKSIGIRQPQVEGDIVLVSHDHFDHNTTRLVTKSNTEIVNEGGDQSINGVDIRGLKSYHDRAEGDKRGDNIIFRFETDGITFCHLGDIGHLPSKELVEEIGDVDFLFIPVGDTFTVGPEEAMNIIDDIEPSIAVPMHYKMGGLSLDIKGIEPFLSQYPEDKTHKVGVELDFLETDLPEETEVWVFSL